MKTIFVTLYSIIFPVFAATNGIKITRQLPSSDPQYQQAITLLQQCAALNLEQPAAKQSLAIDAPLVVYGLLPTSSCAQYHAHLKIIILNENASPACPSLISTLSHELLHHLGYDQPSDPNLHYTTLDPLHVMLKSCLGSLYTHSSRFPQMPSLSPFSRGQSLGPGI